ncbi:MAG TPA: SMC family ATPase [Nocardioides sp.]|nr:SMC family ATPase [Nocardioides sp.]
MRLHHLSVTAFGPFVETADVDFDALSDAGLFLLSGATGAGKSSVLDAVCFALYGAVPGDRQHAGRLRSDQAPPTWAPSVTLDVDLSGRRFRIVRSPAWERPKKRGTGTTREQARVAVTEFVGGEWVPLTSRLDEAGDLVSGLLGMNLDQFCQVALLPQGHFQAFLRADSGQRHQLLARLFRTGRFERVEGWLRDHRLTLRRRSDQHAQVVSNLVSRLSEAAGAPVPEALADPAAATTGALAGWAGATREAAEARRTSAEAGCAEAVEAERSAREALDAARVLATARARVVEAAETVERLEEGAEAHAMERARLDDARRADGLRPLVRLTDERRRALADVLATAQTSRAAIELDGLDPDDLPAELERLTRSLAGMSALLPAEHRLSELRAEEQTGLASLSRLTDTEGLVAAEAETTAACLAELTAHLDATRVSGDVVAEAERAVAADELVVDAHEQIGLLVQERSAVAAEHEAAVRRLLDAREELLDLRERRIAGMAAELAGALVVGDECPVCGSADHPRPASWASGHPDAESERRAQHAVDDAQIAEHALALRVRELDVALQVAREAAGSTDRAGATARLTEARGALTELRDRSARHTRLQERLSETGQRAAELDAAMAEHRVRRAELETALEHVRGHAEALTATVVAARGGHPGLDDAVAHLERRRELVRRAHADAIRRDSASDALAEAETALARAAMEAGFDDPHAARAAEVPSSELAELEQHVREHESALAAARSVLDEPDAWTLLTAPDPDLPACERRHGAAVETLERTRAAAEGATRACRRVGGLADELEAAVSEWAPVRDQLRLATTVAAFAEGKAPDNRLQMRLSAYVLAYRLSQVVAAANARLAGMSDQRYSLEHVGRRGAGESRGGLSLVVRDDWSGESRDPATLSGGETFVVSLALALGLADVVAHEAGGTDLQTLFVDEGFGSLDAETLDDVLDILDSLRENGRAVGVVSHVAEMRDRIPTQLVVSKARSGSTLQVVGSAG